MRDESLSLAFDDYRRSGDCDRLTEIFDQAAPRLRRFAELQGSGPSEADDLVQQTFVAAIERRERFDASRSLMLWLCGILVNEIRRAREQARRRPDPERFDFAGADDPFVAAHARELGDEVRRALERVPEPYRAVLALRLEQELEPREIAIRLSASPSTVRVQLHRGLALLRRALPASLAGSVAMTVLAEPGRASEARRSAAAVGAGSTWLALAASLLLTAMTIAGLVAFDARSASAVSSVTSAAADNAAGGAGPRDAASPSDSGSSNRDVSGGRVREHVFTTGSLVGAPGALPGPRRGGAEAPAAEESSSDPFGPRGVRWLDTTDVHGPTQRYHAASAFDARRGALVLHGGEAPRGVADATWLRDAAGWHAVAAGEGPGRRTRHRLAFDALRGEVVLFGGTHEGRRFDDTWRFDGERWLRADTPRAPAPRYSHGMAFDAARGVIVLHGGAGPGLALFADTWEWDGTEWREARTLHRPPPRLSVQLAADDARGVVVMFGGWCPRHGRALDDTWEFDGVDWREVETAHRPPGRSWHALSHDAARGRVVLFGGLGGPSNRGSAALSDTWEFDGRDWTEIVPTATPESRAAHSMVFDTVRGVVTVFGGSTARDTYGSTFEYPIPDGQEFVPVGPGCADGVPPPRLTTLREGDVHRIAAGPLPNDVELAWLLVQLGPAAAALRVPSLAPHCRLLVEPTIALAAPVAGRFATWRLPLDAFTDPVEVRMQAIAPTAASPGVVLSPALAGTVEPR